MGRPLVLPAVRSLAPAAQAVLDLTTYRLSVELEIRQQSTHCGVRPLPRGLRSATAILLSPVLKRASFSPSPILDSLLPPRKSCLTLPPTPRECCDLICRSRVLRALLFWSRCQAPLLSAALTLESAEQLVWPPPGSLRPHFLPSPTPREGEVMLSRPQFRLHRLVSACGAPSLGQFPSRRKVSVSAHA